MRGFAIATAVAAVLLSAGCARAPYARYAGPAPAPGAISPLAASPFVVPGTSAPSQHQLGTLALPGDADSVVVVVYGDNRPGLRMMTTSWGLPAVVSGLKSPSFVRFLWGIANLPVAAVQCFIPRLDGLRDLASGSWTHLYSGGNEAKVLAAIEREPAGLVVQTGDLVENGRRGAQWARFIERHQPLRTRVPYLAAPGNHERTWHELGRDNWDAAVGRPAEPERYWYAVDLPDSIARFVFLDSNLLADPKHRYPDAQEEALANAQLDWADSVLAAPGARHRFVVLHHPLVMTGRYITDWADDDRRQLPVRRRGRLLEICRRRGVTAVLAGHEHLYQRTWLRGPDGRGFWHITTGGGGSPLYHLTPEERRAARAVRLPDSVAVSWAPSRSVYHYGRLTLLRRPQDGRDPAVLTVQSVSSNGRTSLIERIDLTQPPPEEPREPTRSGS